MFVCVTTMRGEAVAINVATVSYIGKSKSGTVVVLTDGSSFSVRESYEELVSALGEAVEIKTA